MIQIKLLDMHEIRPLRHWGEGLPGYLGSIVNGTNRHSSAVDQSSHTYMGFKEADYGEKRRYEALCVVDPPLARACLPKGSM